MNPLPYQVVMPFRDRGGDPNRSANTAHALRWWRLIHGVFDTRVTGDGRDGDRPFNRSAAYNRAVRDRPDAPGYIFTESDMLIEPNQIEQAVQLAQDTPGMVVPFTQYCYLSEQDSQLVRTGALPTELEPQWTMEQGRSVGAINVVSRRTMDLIGQFDETFEGSWYDDVAMLAAFDTCAGPTRWVPGPAYHLYHLPGHQGQHLSARDRAATAANQARLQLYRKALQLQDSGMMRKLLAGEPDPEPTAYRVMP